MLFLVATVLTACGIETLFKLFQTSFNLPVATVLTACGIETGYISQQGYHFELQQYLPLAVLKPPEVTILLLTVPLVRVATVLTACGIETSISK